MSAKTFSGHYRPNLPRRYPVDEVRETDPVPGSVFFADYDGRPCQRATGCLLREGHDGPHHLEGTR